MTNVVSQLGLNAREVAVVKSLLRLDPRLSEQFEFVEYHISVASGRPADIVLVDADSTESRNQWREFSRRHSLATAIMVTSESQRVGSYVTLHRPLVLKHLSNALFDVIGTHNISTDTLDEAESASRAQDVGACKILVVDDSYPVRKYLEQKLPRLLGKPVTTEFAATGEEAIFKLYESTFTLYETSFDMIFMDVVMPGMDGYSTCKYIKSRYTIPIIMLTSRKSPFDRVRGAMSGCDAYIAKPPDDKKMEEIMRQCLERNAAAVNSGRPGAR